MSEVRTVGELIALLRSYSADRLVFISSDADGNRISALVDSSDSMVAVEDVKSWDVRGSLRAHRCR